MPFPLFFAFASHTKQKTAIGIFIHLIAVTNLLFSATLLLMFSPLYTSPLPRIIVFLFLYVYLLIINHFYTCKNILSIKILICLYIIINIYF